MVKWITDRKQIDASLDILEHKKLHKMTDDEFDDFLFFREFGFHLLRNIGITHIKFTYKIMRDKKCLN